MIIKLYTDGSYNKATPNQTFGACVALDEKDNPFFAQRYISTKSYMVSMRNAGGELVAAGYGAIAVCDYLKIIADLDDISKLKCDICIYYDYLGVERLVSKDTPRQQGTAFYRTMAERVREMCPNVNFEYKHVKGHSNDTWNDIVDGLAKNIIDKRIKEVLVDDFVD